MAGVLDVRWAAWFNGLQVSGQGDETVICGLLADQAALHGVLTKVRDLGYPGIASVAHALPARITRGIPLSEGWRGPRTLRRHARPL